MRVRRAFQPSAVAAALESISVVRAGAHVVHQEMHPFIVHTRRHLGVAHLVRGTLLSERSLDVPSHGVRVYVFRIKGENSLTVVSIKGKNALLGNVHHPFGARLSLLYLPRSLRVGSGHFQLNASHTLDGNGICIDGVAFDRIVIDRRGHISEMNVVGDISGELLGFSLV